MRRLLRHPSLLIVLSSVLLVTLLIGCGSDDTTTPAPIVNTPEASIEDDFSEPVAEIQGTQVVFVELGPSPTPSITPTFDFVIDDYSGIWGLEIDIDVPDGKPEPDIDEWSYNLLVALTVDQYGIITGEGILNPTHYSPACTIGVASYDPFMYRIEGNVRDDPDNNIFFDVTLIPVNAAIPETYNINCVFEDGPRTTAFQYIWPILFEGEQLSYSFPIQNGSSAPDSSFVIDASAVTAQQFDGLLLGTVRLFRQQ